MDKTEEIQRRAAEIDQKLKAAIANSELTANPYQSQGALVDPQTLSVEDFESSEADPLISDRAQIEPQYEQVLILIWQ